MGTNHHDPAELLDPDPRAAPIQVTISNPTRPIVNASAPLLNPSEAAKRLSVSAKTLRLYEQRGLITPPRTEAGWRAYGPDDMARAGEIVTLRRLGLNLVQVARVLDGNAADLDAAFAAKYVALGRQAHDLKNTMEQIRKLRSDLVADKHSTVTDVMRLIEPTRRLAVTFDLPWPWGGERYELNDIQPLMYITGPLGSGKTRLARVSRRRLARRNLPRHGAIG